MSPFVDLHWYTRREVDKEKDKLIEEFIKDLKDPDEGFFGWHDYIESLIKKWEERLK